MCKFIASTGLNRARLIINAGWNKEKKLKNKNNTAEMQKDGRQWRQKAKGRRRQRDRGKGENGGWLFLPEGAQGKAKTMQVQREDFACS